MGDHHDNVRVNRAHQNGNRIARRRPKCGFYSLSFPLPRSSIDEARFPDRNPSQILEHLVRYFEKCDQLPAVTIAIEGDAATIVRGHKYLIAAGMVGRTELRAVIASPPPSSDEVKRFLSRPGVTVLDWEGLKAAEEEDLTPRGWHVFFFSRPRSSEQRRTFDAEARALFSDATLAVLHDDSGPVAEFEAPTPVTDHTWATTNLDAFMRFARLHVPIVSFQGTLFPGFEPAAAPSTPVR